MWGAIRGAEIGDSTVETRTIPQALQAIDLLTEALGGIASTDAQQGTILPGQLPALREQLIAQYGKDLKQAYITAFAEGDQSFRQRGNDLDAPQLSKVRGRSNGYLPFGNPLDDTTLEFLGPRSLDVSTSDNANITIGRRKAGIEKHYEELEAEGGKGLKEARKRVRAAYLAEKTANDPYASVRIARAANESAEWAAWIKRALALLDELFASETADGVIEAAQVYRSVMGSVAPTEKAIATIVQRFLAALRSELG